MAKKAKNETISDLASPSDMKPYLSLSTKDLPAVKDWKIGQTYKLEVEVKMTGANQYEGKFSANFDVLKVSTDDDLDEAMGKGFDRKKGY
jgi:hypothetical protein